MSRLAVLAIVSLAAQWPAPEQQRLLTPPPIVSHKITVLRDWVQAVQRHVPGESDAALLSVAAWSRDDVQAAWIDVQALLALVKDERANQFFVQPTGQRRVFRSFMNNADLDALRQLASKLRSAIEIFLKRATVLHSDVAYEFEINREMPALPSMLSPQRFVVETNDGQQEGVNSGIVHWEFGQLLLDHIPNAQRDEFVRSWYRAALALKLATEELDTPMFTKAMSVLPDDPVIRFQKGCLHDAFAHPAVQVVVASARLPRGLKLDVLSEAHELRQAEAEYRRAIELDPTFGEARLRRGQILARQGKHAEAADELRRALNVVREPLLEYYARLFLGGAEEALGRFSEARALYQTAAALYPLAQSPRLALSQLAHRFGNRGGAREALEPLLEQSSEIDLDDDPWWTYQRAGGRMAEQWREATYRLLPR